MGTEPAGSEAATVPPARARGPFASMLIAGLPLLAGPSRGIDWLSRVWANGTAAILRLTVGLSYELRGREHLPAGPSVIAMKHQSAWETIMLTVLFQHPAIVLKQSLLRIPIFGWYLRRHRSIAIDRHAGMKALKPMIAAAREAVEQGRPIVIFPEGTRTPVGQRQAYQAGVAALYMQLGVPMVPVALNSGLFWGRRAFLKHPGRIVVEILKPIPRGLPRREVMADLETRIEEATARLTGIAPKSAADTPEGSVDKSVDRASMQP